MRSTFDSEDAYIKSISPKWVARKGKTDQWNPVRLSGRVKFRKTPAVNREAWMSNSNYIGETALHEHGGNFVSRNQDYPGCGNQFHNYCQHTSLHGFRYITEGKRNISERIFWICWCIFGISSAMYMMSKIWQKWQDNPVLTSIATTNLPVSEINFPAVTICTVNKAVSEKLIIQGCRYNFTYSQMRKIISSLVDPESRNNDNDPNENEIVPSKNSTRFLRLVSPKCEDYILRCELNGKKTKCKELFKLVLTDSGYCCTFNSMDANSRIIVDATNDTELLKQEEQFLYLQKAVWQYHDQFREKHGNPDTEFNNTKLPTDSLTCSRIYDDDLFPRICGHIKMCRDNPTRCGLNITSPATTTNPPETMGSDSTSVTPGKNGSNLFRAPGAGRSRGLTLMTDTLRCDDVPTDSFKGLRVYVHGADEFPAVSEKGFIVGPGKETQVGVTAIDAYSADALMVFKASNRECFFGSEFKLQYYKEYSRIHTETRETTSSCVIECETNFIHDQCQCVPYYSPAAGNFTICPMKKMLDCVQKAIDAIQKRKVMGVKDETKGPGKPMFNFKPKSQEQEQTCIDFCLPACNETFYNIVVSSATFPNQNNPNKTKLLKEAIADGFVNLADINYVSGSISLLRVYFRESTIMQYKRDELFTWEDFVSNLGGVMSLCLGFSLLSLIEVIYFFTIRQIIDRRRHNKENREKLNNLIIPTVYIN